ncbi:hypothetical protein ACFV3F_03725 [Streptomyces sp. NPDC059717]|uniref:hypothetical protein n=1 Tax=Streptomyces sp. NPDC059717 TaxID=3346922 RepID=UPI0036B66F98
MCIRFTVVDDLTKIAIWDPDEVSILVARGTHPHDLIRELHAILTVDLGAPHIPGAGLTCFCGDPLDIPDELGAIPAASGALTL